MSLADLFHNRAVADQLTALLAGGKLVHAFLFIGGKDSRLKIGKELAKAILCEAPAQGDSCGACVSCRKFDHGNHEDFLYLDLETAPGNAKTQIGVDAVELLQEQLKLKPFGARHAVLIEEAHLLNTAAQNKLLKTLEEPAGDSVIILLAEKKDALLPTVLSRCSTYYLEDEQTQPDEEMLALAKSFLAVCADSPLLYRRRDCIKPLLDEKGKPREKAAEFLQTLELLLREALLLPYGAQRSSLTRDWAAFEGIREKMDQQAIARAVEAAEEAGRCIRLGYNTGYTLKQLCLSL
ncbi:MAG: hypothetical protein K5772_08030 [Clostridia bacterium]|nr:hypothetical protein [Clostridia bacterium]